jgi:hypothetical protein
MIRIALLVSLTLVATACKKKEGDKPAGGDKPAASKSGLAWEPVGLDKLSAGCRKVLECCEEMVKAEKPAATAEDYNLKCSGPMMWSEPDCATDLKARVEVLTSGGKPVPGACK